MNILFTGKGTSGSWQIRGVQIADALGAQAIPMASLRQCKEADVIVGVKRIPEFLLANIRNSGKPFIWDCVDAYPQPACSTWDRERSISWLANMENHLEPHRVIYPNQRMKDDANGDGPVIYHHHRPGIERNPIRSKIEVIGYEGSPTYIDSWRPAIEEECNARGARFVVNPDSLADVDVVLALRGKDFSGYPQRHWKSNVKLANAHGSGTPFIGAPEDGYFETSTGEEYWASTPGGLKAALDRLESKEVRQEINETFLSCTRSVDVAAEEYRICIEWWIEEWRS